MPRTLKYIEEPLDFTNTIRLAYTLRYYNVWIERVKAEKYRGFRSQLNEPPINPLLTHMVAPFVEENNPSFSLQVKVASSKILEITERAVWK